MVSQIEDDSEGEKYGESGSRELERKSMGTVLITRRQPT